MRTTASRVIAALVGAALCAWLAAGCLRAYDTAPEYKAFGAAVWGVGAVWLVAVAGRALLRRRRPH